MPGQRNIVLVSPGFLAEEQRTQVMDVIDRALRANVVVGGLDARGLYAPPPGGDIGFAGAAAGLNAGDLSLLARYRKMSATAESDVLAEIADGTGGTFFHNSNDLKGGLAKLAGAPEYYYVLGFSPENLKYDGSYHPLKVSLSRDYKGSMLQARRGYFAPTHEMNPAEEAKREIRDLLLSRDEYHGLPVTMQVVKARDAKTNLTVLANVDVADLDYQKAHGRNVSSFSVISGIFDRNGKCVSAIEKTVDLHLKDKTLAQRRASGITIKTPFDLAPGSYFVRVVVREAEGQKMAALNGAVEIP